jgi:hypothetical protein
VDGKGTVKGTGLATSCGTQVPVVVTGATSTNTASLHIIGKNMSQFIWDGAGPSTPSGFTAAWAAKGFGVSRTGTGLAIAVTPIPDLKANKQQVLNDLTSLRGTATKPDQGRLDDAIKHLTSSLDVGLWSGQGRLQSNGGEQVFDEEKAAANKLRELINDQKSTLDKIRLQQNINGLVNVDRQLAQIAIDDAIRRNGKANEIRNAQDELAKGDADRGNGKSDSIFDHYKNAWSHAIKV